MSDKLKRMLNDKKTYIVPGVFDCIGALSVQKAGFSSALVSGNAVSASLTGLPDMGLLTMSEVIKTSGYIARSVDIPVIADADTGYGQPLNFRRAVQMFEMEGVSGIHIEDQISPKKCAYYSGPHEIVSEEEYLCKLKAGLDARASKNFCIIARTDAMISYGEKEAVKRANLYLKAGADAVFIVGCSTVKQISDVVKAVDGPVIVNINDESALNSLSNEEWSSLGVKMALYPALLRSCMLKQSLNVLEYLKENGNTYGIKECLSTLKEFQNITELERYSRLEAEYTAGQLK